MKKRVVITGLGFLTSIGHGAQGFWKGILQEKAGIGRVTRFPVDPFKAKHAAEITGFDPAAHFEPRRLKRLDRYAQLTLAAAAQAWEDSGLRPVPENPRDDAGVSFGTALGGIAQAEEAHAKFLEKGPASIPPALALQIFGGAAHSQIAIAHGLRGYATTNSNSCASGGVAVGEAFRVLSEGRARVMLAGGTEAPLAPLTFGAFDRIGAMAQEDSEALDACRPFDTTRSGFVIGEGSAALVLETLEHAQSRGARIYAEMLGYSLNNNAYHMTASPPDDQSLVSVMKMSLENAGREPSDIGYINAHGSGTPMNDEHEANAIRIFFGEQTPPVSATKSYYGHPLGASGAIEAGLCALALHHGHLPPTLNCHAPCVEAPFDLVRLQGRKADIRHVLTNAFGFGGINACLVLGRAP